MAESRYRIVSEIDAQTAPGATKVKQDLRGVQREAKATEQAIARSFDQRRFEASINGLMGRVEQLDKSIGGLTASNATLARSNETLGQTFDRLAASEARATQNTKQQGQAAGDAATKNTQLEAALRRVLNAVDADAAEQARLNALLADAKRLLDAGIISQERYAQVQQLAANAGKGATQMMGAQRIGMQQLGFQLGDIVTMWSLGAKPAQIFASQIGQVVQAVQLMTNGTSKFAAFMGGPWGIGLTLAAIAISPFLGKLLDTNSALDDAVDKLRKDAKETETNRQAKETFARSIEGVTAALAENEKALRDQEDANESSARKSLEAALTERMHAREIERTTEALLKQQLARQRQIQAEQAAPGTEEARQAQDTLAGITAQRIDELNRDLAEVRARIADADKDITRASALRITELADRDEVQKIKDRYDELIQSARERAVAEGKVGNALFRQVQGLRDQRDAEVKLAQERERSNHRIAGVPTFTSREQAIGIAGRELQQAGLRVGENAQFGGVTGEHPGMGNAAHGRFAVDVNSGSGVVEANVPNIKAQFDDLARRYQARGFRVLWNGWVYEANGSGPTRRIPAGQHQHNDHMHVEAPGTIVGKPTQASTEAQARQEDAENQRLEARAADFVQRVVDRAASVGLPANRKSQLAADIEEAYADFERQFDRAASPDERAKIATALTDAEARAQAENFRKAYVDPLERLGALQGKVGLDRAVLNAQLDETARLGRELTPVEARMIENGVRQGDQLERQTRILEEVNGPLAEYRSTVEALVALLERGEISQATFNARLGELGASASEFKAGLPGANSQGVQFAEQGAREEAERERDDNLARLEAYLSEGTILEQEAADIRVAIWRQYNERLREVDSSRLQHASEFFGQLAQLQSSKTKEIAAIGKAAAITQATIDAYVAINKALATLPPPFNIAMAGAIGVTALANVASIAGLRGGGYTGDVGENQVAGWVPVHGREFVVNAPGTRENRALLEAINSGASVRAVRTDRAREAATATRGRVLVQNYGGAAVETREDLTTGDVEIMIDRAIEKKAPRTFARHLADPSSEVSKSLGRHTTATRKRE